MDDKLFQMVENMIKDGRIKIIKLEPDGIRLHISTGQENCLVDIEQSHKKLRKLFYQEYNLFLDGKQIQMIIDYLEIHPVTDTTVYQTANRIYNCLLYTSPSPRD